MDETETLVVKDFGTHVHIRTWAARTDALATELSNALQFPALTTTPHVELFGVARVGSTPDFGWAVELVNSTPLPSLLVSTKIVTHPRRLHVQRFVSIAEHAEFSGEHPGVRELDIRDSQVSWRAPQWPDVGTLRLATYRKATAWLAELCATPELFPSLTTLRLVQNNCDAFLPILAESPLLAKLRVLDLWDSITNRGAQVLHEQHARFSHLEEIWVGARRPRPGEERPRGERDIDDAWSSRLRDKLGARLRFKEPLQRYPWHQRAGSR